MKYCVSARQENTVLNKADEIMLAYKDKDIITDLNLKNPNATIILQIPKTAEVEWVKYQ